jgi:hypothetical protein
MELQEQFPIMTEVQQLEHVRFSSSQIAGPKRVKELYQRGVYHKDSPDHERQEFIRWLYLQVRLQS